MMTLFGKIISIYPELMEEDFRQPRGTICLQNDGAGDYIKEWNHPTLPRPTDAQLEAAQ